MIKRLFVLAVTIMVTGTTHSEGFHGEDRWRHDGRRQQMRVFDARGVVIGLLVANGGQDGVYLTINGTVTFAPITHWTNGGSYMPYLPSRFQWAASSVVFFETGDCTGSPVIGSVVFGIRPSAVVRHDTDAMIYVVGDTNATPITVSSFLNDGLCGKSTGPLPLLRAEATLSLTQRYPEPLTIGY
jgi:hypothetical protein